MRVFLTNDQWRDIGHQLTEKGYTNIDGMLDTTQMIFAKIDTIGKDGVLMYDPARPVDVFHSVFFIKDETTDSYSLYSAKAIYQGPSPVRSELMYNIEKQYCIADGIIPDKQVIENEVMRTVEILGRRDKLRYNGPIENEFLLLGFDEFYDILETGKHYGNLTYLTADRHLPNPTEQGHSKIYFEFVVVTPPRDKDPFIAMVKASLGNELERHKWPSVKGERVFSKSVGPLLDIPQMTAIILSDLQIHRKTFDRVKELFKLDEDPAQKRAEQAKYRRPKR
jgi:hypothetical protein